MSFRVGVVTFPGSNCDADLRHAVDLVDGLESVAIWHKDTELGGVDAVMLPGGFSYGDYLRCGAIARFSPVMDEVLAFARQGGPVLGICNGFQVLAEAGLVPGALVANVGQKFLCQDVHLRPGGRDTPFSQSLPGTMRVPIAHNEGNWVTDKDTLDRVEGEGQVVFRYVTSEGELQDGIAPNGALNDVAGVCNAAGNVLGMMPHPERVVEASVGGVDGLGMFLSLLSWLETR
ncbi:MAG: phosphoribosylformylglycinamidine synthase subunit PurQ [Myxococcota bacterium]|nr:phosphoribosylformylglycinamidine synthase subunit PurQ [Myxococcota bacterium]